MSGGPTDDDKPKIADLIPFPGGKVVDPKEVGIDGYIASQAPSMPQSELLDPREIARDLNERIGYIERQEIVKVTKEHSPTSATIDILLVEIAEEVSHLKWERRQNAKRGKSTAQLTVARIAGLKQLTDILIKRKEASLNERLTTKDPRIQKLFEIWMEMIYSAMDKCSVSPELMDLIFSQIKTDMAEWEIKMESINA